MKKDDAKRLVVEEWDRWAPVNIPAGQAVTGTHGLIFFGHLQQKRLDLLTFKAAGDKWQVIHGWLLQARRISD